MAKSDKSKSKSPTPAKIKSADQNKKVKSANSNKSKSPVPKGKASEGKVKTPESKAKPATDNEPHPGSAKNKPPDAKGGQKLDPKSDPKNKVQPDLELPTENGEVPEGGEGVPEGEEIDPEAEALRATLRRVMVGSLEDLPPIGSKIVRIFTSSTFTDTTTERNSLMETVYPRLKEFCREKHGLEFQVVDMRWGVRDEATDDHMTTELCMNEIANCQRLSMGPNFVVFLGQKYGYRPIPTFILATEFDMIVDVIKEVPSDAALLQQWYKRDDNAVPPVMILQPISSILSNFNNKRHQRLMEKDQAAWWDIMGRLQKMLRKGAQILFLNRKLDREQMHNYFMSVTEREVRHGIINVENTKDHCLAYLRQISNVNMTALRYARNFVDIVGREVDKEAERFLTILRDEHLPAKLPASNIARFTVEWTGKTGIERETHAAYLKEFCDNFYSRITDLVNRAVEENMKLASDLLYSEILQHLHTCMNFCKVFQGREEVVEHVHQYIIGPSTEPLVMWGTNGCGKTSLIAKGYSQVVNWLDPAKPLMLIRFLGTSPDSSAIIPLLTSLCKQIGVHYELSNEDIPEEMSPLVQYFKNLLTLASEQSPIIIFLDSLDQLSPSDGAYQLAWLPVILPPHVKIVVSTLPNYHGIMDAAKRLIESEENYIEITPLGEELAATVMRTWLARANRTVSEEQWKMVTEAIKKCNVPLFIKLVFDEICRWRSNLKPQMTTLADSIHNSVIKLFDRIENQHGKILVSHAFGYITAAKSGLSEAELEDLLSLDEKVLNDVYQYHLPPVRRIPPLLWTRIRNDLPNYFAEREADGVNVIFWYHRQFIEASKERYFRNLNFLQEMHSLIADYFLGIWGGGVKKPFEYSELQRQRFFLDSTKGAEDRKVPEQPLCFRDPNGKVTRHNLRKLSELPFHLLRAHRFDDLYKEVLCNFRWLHAKLSCMPLQSVLVDFEEFLEVKDDRDIKLLADALRLSASVLSRYPEMVGPQIVGRLLPYYSTNEKIQLLIHQCDTDGLEVNALSPSFHCMHTPGGPLQYSLEGHPFAPFGVGNTSDTKYLVSVSNVFIIWDLTTGDVFRQINPSIQGIMQNLKISPDDKHCVSYTNNNQVIICSVMTGDYIILDKKLDKGQELIGATLNNTHVLVWSAKQWFIYTINGELVRKDNYFKKQVSIIIAGLSPQADKDVFVVWKPDTVLQGVETEEDMTLEILDGETDQFDFHSAIAVTRDRRTLYACIAISDEAIACYKRSGTTWAYDRTLRSNYDKVFCLMLSKDEQYLAAMVVYGYKLWNLKTDELLQLKLPTGVRNIPTKNQLVSILLEFTKNSEYLVAGVRKNLYVWDTNNGDLVKTLDAHFGRIIAMSSVSNQSVNKVISSSIDKTIKVWNFANIRENVFSIDRLEKPIEAVSLAAHAHLGATTTRNCVGIWNLENGNIAKTLANSAHSSIVTHSVLNSDASYLVSAESGQVLIWDVDKEKVIKQDAQEDVLQLFLTENDSKSITVSRSDANHCKLVCRAIPSGDVVYQFEYMCKTFRNCVVTADGLHIVTCALHKKTEANTLRIYHAKTGSFMYETTPKYNNYKEFHQLVAMPNEPNHVALIDSDKGNFWDIKKKCFVRSIQRWNGVCSSNGKYGLYAPNRGGLEMLDLKTGKTIHVMIPKVAEGVFDTMTLFTKNDNHVVYYHCGHRTIRVFRVSDGKQIANYKAHAEIKAIESTQGGMAIVLGAVDGSLVVLSVADPQKQENCDFLLSLPSRQVKDADLEETSGKEKSSTAGGKAGLTTTSGKMASIAHVARVTAKAKQAQRSRACVLS